MFKPVNSKPSFPELEEGVLRFWREKRVFERSLEVRQGGFSTLRQDSGQAGSGGPPLFMLYEGPPTANNKPGVHHVLARVFKDIIPRYKTMRGYYCPRKGGWDTHGLPVELEVERELGFTSKADIEAYGIDRFNARCKESVFRYVKDWEAMTERIGFWVDMAHAYITLDNDYIETVWWIIKQLWDKGLVYQGYKVTPHCPRCGTSLSSHEVALGYRDDAVDPSVYVRFRMRRDVQYEGDEIDREGLRKLGYDVQRARWSGEVPSLLVWTTTPWTLTANMAAAIAPDETYVLVEATGDEGVVERLILAKARVESVLGDRVRKVVAELSARELAYKYYEPVYPFTKPQPYHRVLLAAFVSMEEGTGIVHIAPAYGEEDLELGHKSDLPVTHTVNQDGTLNESVEPWAGKFVKDADPLITADLRQRGLLFRSENITHTYPFCWRCNSPLLYYAKTSWYIRTTAVKAALIAGNRQINWYPEHIREGRFGDWLENNVDWALSRERYWGTPFPVWRCQGCGHEEAVGSRAELRAKPGLEGSGQAMDLHRPYIDGVTFACPQCDGRMRRLPEVIDCWFDSGAMPLAQFHFPFEKEKDISELEKAGRFPADYICEAVDQTRGWFYSLHAISTLLFGRPSYRNVICLGHILDEQGEKMSKSKGNVVDPWQVINAYGADALRWYLYTASPAGSARRFSLGLVGEVVRGFFLTLWNTYSFFVTYANIDGFDPRAHTAPRESRSDPSTGSGQALDRWVLSRLNRLIAGVTGNLDGYDPTTAGRLIEQFVDELSNWYVRRSRRRFWKPAQRGLEGSESDADKWAAYSTLYECLVTLAKLLAPFTPFLAEEMYRNLVASVDPDKSGPESVHLADFPVPDPALVDPALEGAMALAMRASSLGRAARAQAGLKVRQPLARALVKVRTSGEREWLGRLAYIVADELNVKEVAPLDDESLVVSWQVRPNTPVLGPKYGGRLPEVTRALASREPAEVAGLVRAGKPVALGPDMSGLSPEEVLVSPKPRPGYAVAAEGDYLVAVTTELTQELRDEGLARELVRTIQNMRKKAGFEMTDRSTTYYWGGDALRRAMSGFASYIQQETLSLRLVEGEPPSSAYVEQHKLDGVAATLAVARQS